MHYVFWVQKRAETPALQLGEIELATLAWRLIQL